MGKKQKKLMIRIIIAAILYIGALICDHYLNLTFPTGLIIFAVPYIIAAADVYKSAFQNISHGEIFDENFLMIIASVGAFAIGEYPEAVAVMLFYQVGELFQSIAVDRSRRSISDLMDICPEYANIPDGEGISQVDPSDLSVGDTIIIKAGERVPLDCRVVQGHSFIDTSALTGESVPRQANEGDEILSGCVNGKGTLYAEVTKEFDNSTVARILELVENAVSNKAKSERIITKFAKYYTPIVVAAAAILGIIVPIFAGNFPGWIHRACVFLVTSCPCALVISIPMGLFCGIGVASRRGIMVKGSNYLEAAAKLDTVVFDKTGTLTEGKFKVTQVVPENMPESSLLELAAIAESFSDHPIAASILEAYGSKPDIGRAKDIREIAGQGIEAVIDGRLICVGNEKLMRAHGITVPQGEKCGGTQIYVCADENYFGRIVISDEIKHSAADAIAQLRELGVKKAVMLTGDNAAAARSVSKQLGIDETYSQLLPEEKADKLEQLLAQKTGGTLAFVGDGINDAPVLMLSDLGVAMGGIGSDAAIEAADIVLMDDDPRKLAEAVRISRFTMRVVWANIIFALAVKFLILILGALGIVGLWAAVFADVGVTVIAVLNSMRVLSFKSSQK